MPVINHDLGGILHHNRFSICGNVALIILALSISPHGQERLTAPSATQVLSLCDLLSRAAEFDGKQITVRGIYQFEIHGAELFAQQCTSRNDRVNLRHAPEYKSDKRTQEAWHRVGRHQPAEVVVRGKFSVAQEGCFGAACDLYEVEVHEYVAVEPLRTRPTI